MKRDEQTFAIIGAAMEVHRQLGHGFLEAVYQEALAIAFDLRKIPFQREAELPVVYKEQKLLCSYKADFICYGEVIVELKALAALTGKEKSQIINYLKASNLMRALLLNFGAPSLQHERVVLNYSEQSAESAQSADTDVS